MARTIPTHFAIRCHQVKHVRQAWHVGSRHQDSGAKRKRRPNPCIPRDFIVEETRGGMTHIKDMPELGAKASHWRQREGYPKARTLLDQGIV